jgi:hypothetical protein
MGFLSFRDPEEPIGPDGSHRTGPESERTRFQPTMRGIGPDGRPGTGE